MNVRIFNHGSEPSWDNAIAVYRGPNTVWCTKFESRDVMIEQKELIERSGYKVVFAACDGERLYLLDTYKSPGKPT